MVPAKSPPIIKLETHNNSKNSKNMKLGNYVCKYLGIVISWCLYRDLE